MDRILRIAFRVVVLGALAFSSAALTEYVFHTSTYCQPGGGCDVVRAWIGPLGMLLPVLGLLGFTILFAGSFFEDRTTTRIVAFFAGLGALVAVGLLYVQSAEIGIFCGICVAVDSLAIAAGFLAVVLAARATLSERGEDSRPRLLNPWWAVWVLASFAPIAWARLLPDPPLPAAIRHLYRPGAINVVEMADFECPYCRAMHPVLREALEHAEGEVNLVRIVVPLSFHPHARDAARAYFCAIRQDRGEPMADRLFATDDLTRNGSVAIARELGLDVDAFERCLPEPAIEREIARNERLAERAEMQGLPSVYIGERVFVGFDPTGGGGHFRDALRAARTSQGRRVQWWWLASVFIMALVLGVTGALAQRRR